MSTYHCKPPNSENRQILLLGVVILMALLPVLRFGRMVMAETHGPRVVVATLVMIAFLCVAMLAAKLRFREQYLQHRRASKLAAAVRAGNFMSNDKNISGSGLEGKGAAGGGVWN
jgi:ABC-type nickel/cobalt efflux system permease component RcnA